MKKITLKVIEEGHIEKYLFYSGLKIFLVFGVLQHSKIIFLKISGPILVISPPNLYQDLIKIFYTFIELKLSLTNILRFANFGSNRILSFRYDATCSLKIGKFSMQSLKIPQKIYIKMHHFSIENIHKNPKKQL